MPEQRRGFLFGFGAYFLWGLFPLYWALFQRSGAIEVLSHRVVWSMVTITALLVVRRRIPQLKVIWSDPRRRWPLIAAAVLISFNWGAFIWGTNHGHVVEVSLGYFINPLFTVALGVVLLGERLRPVQLVAIGIATVAVVGLTVEYGRPPWIALILTVSFGLYGLAKKKAGAGAIEGMALETAALTPVAIGALAVMAAQGAATATADGPGYLALLLLAGPVTTVPLLMFAGAANRVSMTTLGTLQYITPSMQFALGVLVFHEAMPTMRWIGFGLVWLALLVFTVDALANRRRTLARTAELATVA